MAQTKFKGSLAWLIGLLLVTSTSAAAGEIKNGFRLESPLVPVEDIYSGGPPRDGIPAIDNPRFLKAKNATFLSPESRVIGVQIGDKARAYPVAILNWHEVVNDRLAGTPLVVTYCPLCGTGVVYYAESSSDHGRALDFGVSGLLYNSDVLLYDRQTESLWSQLKHQAISGPLKGNRLTQLPATFTRWSEWQRRHPSTDVLSTDTGYRRDYERNPYGGYDESVALYFPVEFLSQQFHPKERVLGVEIDGISKAYPFAELSHNGKSGVIKDEIGNQHIQIRYDADARWAELLDSEGKLLPAINSFWFAWYTFNPETLIYRATP